VSEVATGPQEADGPGEAPPRVLKRDVLGRVELVRSGGVPVVRRVASGSRVPGSRLCARLLLARERRALTVLCGLPGIPALLEAPRDGASLVRSFVPGLPLCLAEVLPRDFFERLEDLVRTLHARGVCHNDLHKEANVLVDEGGRPALVDFQLASHHVRRGRTFSVRANEDLRHVWKHRTHYLRALGEEDPMPIPPRRSLLAAGWRRFGKPLYRVFLSGRLASGEPRRSAGGPWPRWSAPVGPLPPVLTPSGSSPGAPSRAR